MCKQHAKIVAHITSRCSKLAGTKYTKKHHSVASIVFRAISAEYNLEHSKDWCVEQEKVARNDNAEILWDFPIQTDKHLLRNRPDIVLIIYKEQTGFIIDISVPRDENILNKTLEKLVKHQSLKIELEPLLKVRIMVIPVIVGALGAIADRLPGWLAHIPGTISEVELQKSALLGTAQVLRRVLRLPGLW